MHDTVLNVYPGHGGTKTSKCTVHSTMFRFVRRLLYIAAAVIPVAAAAQEPDTMETQYLPEVEIEAARGTATSATAPFSVSIRRRSEDEVALEPALSLDETLEDLPGLWINNRGHFAVGERISVRGLGWRAAFGVRGIQVVLDGIPLTLPDGQTYTEIVEPSLIRRAELIRGPSSRFWGNGSGGVLFLSTARPTDRASVRARALAGSYGTRQLLAQGGTPLGDHYVQVYASNIRQDGYRQYSAGRRTRAGLHGRFDLGAETSLRALFAFVNQDTENPSSLTREQLEQNPRLARPDFVEAGAGKQSTQAQTGLSLEHQTPLGLLSAAAYGLVRDLNNPLPFGYISYLRHSAGTRVTLQEEYGRLEWGAGLDASFQRDDRQNWNIVSGQRGDERQLDQLETVTEAAASGYVDYDLTSRLQASLSLRGTRIRFESDDRLMQSDDEALAGDQSGGRTLTAWSPAAGLSYRWGPTILFANYSTAFETPTTTELVNRPDATGGFNLQLDPQRTRGVEAGARGAWPSARLQFDLALFYMTVENAIVQTGTNELGREFFGNAGTNLHRGLEATATWQPASFLELHTSYTGNQITYRSGALEGNRVPGIPDHRFYGRLKSTVRDLWLRLGVEAASDFYVNDANTAESDGYTVVDARVGHEGLVLRNVELEPFAAVNNVFDVQYNASVMVNAFGGRFYEPAPGRSLQVGLNVTLQ